MLNVVLWIDGIYFVLAVLLSLRIGYLIFIKKQDAETSSKGQFGLASLAVLIWLGFLILAISSFMGMLLSILIGNWAWLVVIYLVAVIFYTVKKHRKYNHD